MVVLDVYLFRPAHDYVIREQASKTATSTTIIVPVSAWGIDAVLPFLDPANLAPTTSHSSLSARAGKYGNKHVRGLLPLSLPSTATLTKRVGENFYRLSYSVDRKVCSHFRCLPAVAPFRLPLSHQRDRLFPTVRSPPLLVESSHCFLLCPSRRPPCPACRMLLERLHRQRRETVATRMTFPWFQLMCPTPPHPPHHPRVMVQATFPRSTFPRSLSKRWSHAVAPVHREQRRCKQSQAWTRMLFRS